MPAGNGMGNVEVGQRYGRFVAVSFQGFADGSRAALWRCVCDCGNTKTVRAAHLRGGASSSCGCLQREVAATSSTTHGHNGTPLHRLWINVKNRCGNQRGQDYARYGGRGITMHPAWRDSFVEFASGVGEHPGPGWTLERIDNDGDYSPGNVRWATRKEQARNTSRSVRIRYLGQERTLPEWCDLLGVNYDAVLSARYNGEDVTLALHRRALQASGISLRSTRSLTVSDVPQTPIL